MDFHDEKDYIMRMIKELASVIFSLILGKQNKSVELQNENKYEVSGKALEELQNMVDQGLVNEAENILLENIDYTNQQEIIAAVLFYQYVSEKDTDFLTLHNYTRDEALDGLKALAERSGYGKMNEIFSAIT